MQRSPIGFSYLADVLPEFATRIDRLPLGDFPTPVRPLAFDRCDLFVKCDDESNPVYGGNKLRKLEYLLAQAQAFGAKRIATFGAAGSNHALATAVHATALGIRPIAFLCHQHPGPRIARTLSVHRALGTEIVFWGGPPGRRRAIVRDTIRRQPERTWVVPMGGSSWLGAVGYVNAALELARQIERGLAPEPHRIYMPLGTMGSVAGLAIGLRLAGLKSTLVAVRVVDSHIAVADKLAAFIAKTVELMARHAGRRIDPPGPDAIEFRDDQLGGGYAQPTPAAEDAVAHAAQAWGIGLETTYSGKALAALLSDHERGRLDGLDVLFWNTYNSATLELPSNPCRTAALPPELDVYLE